MRRLCICLMLLGCKVSPSENKKPIKHEPIAVSYRLDPRLAGGTYGGERWIAGPSYTSSAQPGPTAVVEAKASKTTTWSASDTRMVSVAPVSAGRVRITVNKPGESTLTLRNEDTTTELVVRGLAVGSSAMQVQIAQKGETL